MGLASLSLGVAPVAPAAGKSIGLPFNMTDAAGNSWMIYNNGMIQQQNGNSPVFAQLAQLTVNNAGMPMMRPNQQAHQDEKTGEIVIENLSAGQVKVTRHILIKAEDGSVRYVDTFTNPAAKEVTANLQYTSNLNFGVQTAKMVMDPKHKDAQLGWAGTTNGNKTAYMTWGFSGGKIAPRINYPEGSNLLQVAYSLTIPANGSVSLLHAHGTADTLDKATETIAGLRANKLLTGASAALRKTVVNASMRSGLPEDLELLRGDATDIVETRGGDQLRGTLTDTTYALKTAFGRVELPSTHVISVLTVGKQHPLQLVVTDEGEIFGGAMEREFLTMELSSGQTIKIPLSQLNRAGYRKRDGEPEEIFLSKPSISLRTGERMAISPPAGPLTVASRYGVLKLPTESVGSIALKAEDSPVHVVTLVDGSRFSGIFLSEGKLDVMLDGAAGKVPLSVPAAAVSRIKPTTMPSDAADASDDDGVRPELRCSGEDVFRGSLDGEFQIDTPFQGIDIKGDQVRRIARADPASSDIQVTMWDGTTVTGQPRQPVLNLKLAGGVVVGIPVDLLESYNNPVPRPSDEMTTRIKALVVKLNDDDFKARESAQTALIASGSPIIPILRELRATQPPEGQQRIDQIIAQLDK